jgi:DNA-binding winged helix-turn-helix (wHTH) protein/TolB-like protein/Flp pilus assembly protein TadD
MTKSLKPALFYEFGSFRLDPTKRLLLRDGSPIHLVPKAFDTLLVLVENHGGVVEKTELINQVWPDSFVEEINLTVYISMLRKILGDNPDEHQFIVTCPRRGYSFVAQVNEICNEDTPIANASPSTESKACEVVEAEKEAPDNAQEPETLAEQEAIGEVRKTLSINHRLRIRQYKWLHHFPIMVGLLGLVAAGLWLFLLGKALPKSGNSGTRSIAVLPFKLLGSQQEVNLELGMADALITRLSKLEQIAVRPSSVIFAYAGKNYDPVAVGRELGVDAVMQGTVQQTNNRIRVSVQLINVADGRPLWADHFDEERVDIFTIQDSISEQVARAMALKFTDKQIKQLSLRSTESVEAYQAYSRGLYFWSMRTDDALKKSVEYFQQAIAIDPKYAKAYAVLADSFALMAIRNMDEKVVREFSEKTRAAALKTFEIDETVAEAHTALATVIWECDRDAMEAEREYKRAIELNPTYSTAHQRYAWLLLGNGQLNRASQEMQQAAELDPLSRVNNVAWATFLYYLGETDQAIERCKKILEISPDYPTAIYVLALAYEQKGQYEQAIKELMTFNEMNQKEMMKYRDMSQGGKEDPMYYADLGHMYGASGRLQDARRMIRKLENLEKTDNNATYGLSLVYAGLGDKDQTLDWLEKGATASAAFALYRFKYDPRFAFVREDPRFEDFLRIRAEAFARRR